MRSASAVNRIAHNVRRAALRLAPRFLCEERGVAAVEFAMILPIMVVLWFGGVEVTQALSVDRRLNNLASSIGDLAARDKKLSWSEVDQIFDIAPGAIFPFSSTSLRMRLTGVKITTAGNASVAWSRAEGAGITAYSDGQSMNSVIPASLRPSGAAAESQIIMAEAYYNYIPTVGHLFLNFNDGMVALEDRMFFVPRLVAKIPLCQSVDPDTNCLPS